MNSGARGNVLPRPGPRRVSIVALEVSGELPLSEALNKIAARSSRRRPVTSILPIDGTPYVLWEGPDDFFTIAAPVWEED